MFFFLVKKHKNNERGHKYAPFWCQIEQLMMLSTFVLNIFSFGLPSLTLQKLSYILYSFGEINLPSSQAELLFRSAPKPA